ncbi:MAG: UvrD-helicase domain-containing protein [Actinomycetota bacterium]|nr:UvrD-helicase domain-containing protein [Actinomycetota bacterium]
MRPVLAPEQDAVVHAPDGDLFVAAGAGSGKTHVLVSRFVAAVLGEGPLEERRVEEILAITFTEKAAGELTERVRAALHRAGRPQEARTVEDAWVSTIHGMCSRMLRRHAFEIGLDPTFGVCTNVQAAVLVQSAFETAARELLAESKETEALILDLGAAAVCRAVVSAHNQVRSMGRSPGDISPGAEVTTSELTALSAGLASVSGTFASFPETVTTARNATLARDSVLSLEALVAEGCPADSAHALLGTVGSVSFYKRGGEEVKEAAGHGNVLREAVVGVLTQIVCAPYEVAFAGLLERFGARYANLKDAAGLLDFEDLQIKTAELFEAYPDVADAYRSAFRHVMIDEFQDTNALQMRIARSLSDGDLLTVGDDKQSIYRFRHADVSVFKHLEAGASNVRRLAANYRSHADVLGAINELFGSTALFGSDLARLAPMRDEGEAPPWPSGEPRVRMLVLDDRELVGEARKEAEARALARHFAILRQQGVRQGDMAVLVRAMQNRAERIERALRDEGFDVYVASGGTFFSRPEVEDILALLRVVDNPRDDRALMQVLAGRITGLSDDALHGISSLPAKRLWDSVVDGLQGCTLGATDAALLVRTVATIKGLREARGHQSIAALIHEACERLDYDLALFASGSGGPRAWANVLKVSRLAGEFERGSAGDLGGFLDYMASYREVSPETQAALASEDVDAVRIMSVHAAKGLEFPVVAVADLGSKPRVDADMVLLGRGDDHRLAMRLPASASPDGEAHETAAYSELRAAEAAADEEEGRRVLYVACTRAREALVLCGSADPTKEAKGSCALDVLRIAAGLEGPIEDSEAVVSLGGKSSLTLSVVVAETPRSAVCEVPLEPAYDPAAFAQDTRIARPRSTRPRTISYTGLADYKACPYRFYAGKIAGLRTPEVIRPGTRPLQFGSAVHAALQCAGGAMPPLEMLEATARAYALDEDGRARLESAVRAFADSTVAREVSQADTVIRECPLFVPLGRTMLTGTIDLIAWRGAEATIVDYKTGMGELSPGEDGERFRTQAECYALAAFKAGAATVTVRFVEVERECRETRYAFTLPDLDAIERALLDTLDLMERGEFPHRAEFEAEVCGECPALGGVCPINPRRGASDGVDRKPR